MTPGIKARFFSQGWGVSSAGLILIGAALAVLVIGSAVAVRRAVKAQTNFIDISSLTVSDPSMVAIGAMVERGDVWGAGARIGSSYQFDKPAGLMALREFSVLVLRSGLAERDRYERCYVKSALAAAGDRDEVAQLVNTFQNTSELGLKMAVADGLGDANAAGTLLQLYTQTEPAYRRIVVNGAARSHDPRVIDLIEQALTAPDRTMRLTAAKGLGQLGSSAAIPVLRRFLAAAEDPLEKAMSAWSLLRLGDRSAEETALSILTGRNDDDARAIAAVALGRARDAGAVEALRRAMSGDKIDVRIGAAVALTHYADPQAVMFLLSAVQDEDSVTRLHVGQLLDEMDFGNARMVVRSAVSSPDMELNLLGIRAIGISGNAEDIPFLLDAADKSGDPIARAEVAWALGRLGCRASVVPLIAMISEPDHSVRYTAAEALDHAAMRLLKQERACGA